MSRSGEAFGKSASGGRLRDVKVCRYCGHRRCCTANDVLEICRFPGHGDGGVLLPDSLAPGGFASYHWRDDVPREARVTAATADRAPRAEPDVLHTAYTALLGALPLDTHHREALTRRGLTPERIARNGYASYQRSYAQRAVEAAASAVGESAGMVPGILRRGTSWELSCGPALLIPCRDLAGRIVAIKARPDNPTADGPKYYYVSSTKYDGPGPSLVVHVPLDGTGDELRITEGELKADVAQALSGVRTVSVPGVSAWRGVLPVVEALAPVRVRVAYDMDMLRNPAVAASATALMRALGKRCVVERWNPRTKGVDDAYLAMRS